MPDPYLYVRAITLGLGTLWTLMGLRRILRFAHLWSGRLAYVGLEERWMRRQIAIVTLRTTILDPINLALFLTLVGTWLLRARIS